MPKEPIPRIRTHHSLYITDDLWAHISILAARKNMPTSSYIALLLKEHADENPIKKSEKNARKEKVIHG